MGNVAGVVARKGRHVHTIACDATVYEAVEKMVSLSLGSLLVMDGETICGIVTERDYLRDIVLRGRTSKTTRVDEIMSEKIVCVPGDCTVGEAMRIMTERRVRHLPVVEDGKLAGLVSIGDLVKQVSQDQQVEIAYLTDYITGKYPG